MDDEKEKIGVARVVQGAFDDAAKVAYAKAFDEKRDTTGGLGTMDDCMSGAALFDVIHDSETVGRYALKSIKRANGTEVFIVAAAGALAGVGLIETLLPHIENQCAHADRLTINTARKGLVKKLIGQGWTLDSYVMRKKINE